MFDEKYYEKAVNDFLSWIRDNFPDECKKEGKHVFDIAKKIMMESPNFKVSKLMSEIDYLKDEIYYLKFPGGK